MLDFIFRVLAKRTIYIIAHRYMTIRLAKLGSGDKRLDIRLWHYALYITWEGIHSWNRRFLINTSSKHLIVSLHLWPITILLERVWPREWKEMST